MTFQAAPRMADILARVSTLAELTGLFRALACVLADRMHPKDFAVLLSAVAADVDQAPAAASEAAPRARTCAEGTPAP